MPILGQRATALQKLIVPLIPQHEQFYCVPACIKMVLEYLNQRGKLTAPLPDLTISDIAKAIKTQDGTWAPDVPLLNPLLEEANPSVEFEDAYRSRRVEEIDGEIDAGRPCIPFLYLTDGVHHTWHAVVVSYIKIDRNTITINDPGPAIERTMVLSEFQGLWTRAWTTLLKVQIGRSTRTVLTQFEMEPAK